MRDEKGVIHYDPYETEQQEWKKQQVKDGAKQLLTIISPIIILLLWEIFSRTGILDIRFFPPPSAIVSTFFDLAGSGQLWTHISVSLYRIAAGFLLGVIP